MIKVQNIHYTENYRSEISILLGNAYRSLGNWSHVKITMSSGNIRNQFLSDIVPQLRTVATTTPQQRNLKTCNHRFHNKVLQTL
jgi:hypothetical protein